MGHNILVVDDEQDIRELLGISMRRWGHQVTTVETVREAKAVLADSKIDFCLTDMRLPDGTGLTLIDHIQDNYPDVPVAMLTAYGNVDLAVDALKRGAFDFLTKPLEVARLQELVDHAISTAGMPKASPGQKNDSPFIGSSPAVKILHKTLEKLARSQAPVLIFGESGSGKELAAQTIHRLSSRSNQAFVPVNCGAIPSELVESEFFGHKKGSFTGANQDKTGLFQAANGGTLFLDEVGDLPLQMQVKLLRAIQEKRVRPVGAEQEVAVDVRIISASHRNLAELVNHGEFRQDLFYRLNVIDVHIPPLRDRPGDIPELCKHFLKIAAEEMGTPVARLSDEAITALNRHSYPGNIRELINILQRASTLCEDGLITPDDLQLSVHDIISTVQQTAAPGRHWSHYPSLDAYLDELEKEALVATLEQHNWNKTAAAETLGITFRSIRYRLKKLGLEE